MEYCYPVIDNTPLVQKVKVPAGLLEFYDPDYPEQNIMVLDTDGVKFYNSDGDLVLEANKNAINWLGGSVIADSTRVAEDVTADTFLKNITLAAGQIAELHIYVERLSLGKAYAELHAEVINWKDEFAPEVIAISSVARKLSGLDIGIAVASAVGSNVLAVTVTNASGGKLIYELRYRLAMAY